MPGPNLKRLSEKDLGALAKNLRLAAGESRAQAARALKVSQTSIHHAEESPQLSLFKLRKRLIEKYAGAQLQGPFFALE